jgi:hypothetical protein
VSIFLEMQALSPALADKARQNLKEPEDAAAVFEQARLEVVALIGEEEQKRFDWALLAMLRQAKWDKAAAVKKMCALSKYASKNSHLFVDSTADEFIVQAEIGMMSHLPVRNSRGELVLLLDGVKLTPYAKKFTMTDMLRFSVFYMSKLMVSEETQINGVIILENLHNYPMLALNSMKGGSLSGIRASFEWMHLSPLRLRGLYAIKQPWYIGMMLGLTRPFMPRKLRERVYLFGEDTSAMLEAAGLTPEQVPPEYGGTLEGFDYCWHLKQQLSFERAAQMPGVVEAIKPVAALW